MMKTFGFFLFCMFFRSGVESSLTKVGDTWVCSTFLTDLPAMTIKTHPGAAGKALHQTAADPRLPFFGVIVAAGFSPPAAHPTPAV
ncbi:hypothetical protein [Hoeflea marina]|uniref:hypothetical protein n=1 Tax=Hoeflea marina TaxID=274592 RepID=UPI0011B3B3A8|nr:hypothetical protein [Hoeflea marina]